VRERARGFATGDLLLILAVATIGLALALPAIRQQRVRRAAAAAGAEVDSVRAAAERYRARVGSWPAAVASHQLPPALAAALPDTAVSSTRPYRIGWRVWELLEEWEEPSPEQPVITADPLPPPDTLPPPPPQIRELAGIVVRSADPRILAALLARYDDERSFVRDSTWTLLVATDGDGP